MSLSNDVLMKRPSSIASNNLLHLTILHAHAQSILTSWDSLLVYEEVPREHFVEKGYDTINDNVKQIRGKSTVLINLAVLIPSKSFLSD